jgi:release factor glutamine methyltransferase
LLEPLPEFVDLIVANLPYISEVEWSELPPGIREYEPKEALFGGEDGLYHIRRLLVQAGGHLKPYGGILLEIGAPQGKVVKELARKHFPKAMVEVIKDYAGLDRVVKILNKGVKGRREVCYSLDSAPMSFIS